MCHRLVPQITLIFYPGGNVAPITLGDDAIGWNASSLLPKSKPQTESRPIAGSSYPVLLEHLNNEKTLTWTTDYNLLTTDAAFVFKATHADAIGVNPGLAQGTLAEMLDDGTANFYQGCTRPAVEIASYIGQNVVVKYTVQYQYVTDTLNPV